MKAMLKLTNSFCRYLKFIQFKFHSIQIQNINFKVHVREFTHLSCRRKQCSDILYAKHTAQAQVRQFGNSRKTFRIKIPPLNSNDIEDTKQMSELRPTVNHVSYGGQFDIASSDDANVDDWKRQPDETATADDMDNRRSVPIPPDFRVWETVGKKRDVSDGNTLMFKVMSYNVLAQYLLECHPYLYTECSSRDLKWKLRAARLYDEIINLAPDILCLQEVQASHIDSFYAKFEEIGYCGIFKQKTGQRHDGCAIYFKRSLFILEEHISVEFYQPELPILNRDNIGIIVKLVPRHLPGSPIVVATTHLLYNPKRTDVRLAQMQVFLAEIDRFAYYSNGRESGHLPIILTGDFNSTPESAVTKLLDRGQVRVSSFRDNSDWTRIGVTDNCQHLAVYLNRQAGRTTDFSSVKIYNSDYSSSMSREEGAAGSSSENFSELFNSEEIGHSLSLNSVYNKYKSDGQYEASTFQDYWVTVDYIYFSRCSILRLVERLRLPTTTECEELRRLPNEVYASDHLALAAVFELKPYKSAL